MSVDFYDDEPERPDYEADEDAREAAQDDALAEALDEQAAEALLADLLREIACLTTARPGARPAPPSRARRVGHVLAWVAMAAFSALVITGAYLVLAAIVRALSV